MNHVIAILKNWTLPISITMGALVFVMLFITFCKINPRHMQIKRWHLILVLFQILSCVLIAAMLFFYPSFPYRIGAEGAMVCLIAPSSYILWQNIINSWQLWHYNKKQSKK